MPQYPIGLYQLDDNPSVETEAMLIEKASEQPRRKDNSR